MLNYEVFKPIRNFGLLLSIVGALGIVCHFTFMRDPEYTIAFQVFLMLVSVFHLFVGINIVSRNRMGYKSLKLYLYLIYPGFPLGYFFAKKTFEYIKTHKIEQFYRKSIEI